MAKILVVEDERIVAEDIVSSLGELGHQETRFADDFDSALSEVNSFKPDLVLLDIKLRGQKSGIELAKELVEKHKLPIIYLSSNSDSVTLKKAFETAPQAFLTKPFNDRDLGIAVELAIHNTGRKVEDVNVIDNAVFVRKSDRYVKVHFRDILFIKSEGSYCQLVTHRENHTLAVNSQRFLELVDSPIFTRVHRSYIVNLNNVDSYNANYVFVGPEHIPISRSQYPILTKLLKKV